MSEHDEQTALFSLIAKYEAQYPELGLAFAIPNGGHRHVSVASKLKQEGVKAGVPDIFLPVMRYEGWEHDVPYGGLFIELKYGKNRCQPSQTAWHVKLHNAGYKVVVCYGWQEAWDAICGYLGIQA